MNNKIFFRICVVLLFLFFSIISFADTGDVLKIYIDADRTGTRASGISIEQGIRLALSEINYSIAGYRIELVLRDHHGSSRRSRLHLEEYINDPDALVVFCGLHSPPVLANLDYINEQGILLLDPWAAAGPITRSTDLDGKNWVFRLSVDDMHAGEMIIAHACETDGFRKPVLLLEDTGWGRSNESTMTTALERRGLRPLDIIWFNWHIGENGAREILNDIYSLGADVIVMVANAPEGITFIKAMSERSSSERLPVRSHWGITGGNFFETLGPELLVNNLDLQFIQTSFSFLDADQSSFSRDVFSRASSMFPEIKTPEDIKAPSGFIHSYDLTRILIAALSRTELTGNMVRDRRLVRETLEHLETPVQGLIKTYLQPFGVYSETNRSAHEALGLQELRMAEYTAKGGIRIVEE